MATQGISGVGLAVATAGGLLVYAGFRNINPIAALREIASGNPQAIQSSTANLAGIFDSGGATSGLVPLPGDATAANSSSPLVRAAYSFRGDKYSQAKRWQNGYSDCSSFVGKSLKKIGITPPGGSVTGSYLASPSWTKISRTDARAGDIAVNTSHMAIFSSNVNGIGQQNSRRNVQMDTMANLMSGTGSYTCLRYKFSLAGSVSDSSSSAAEALEQQAANAAAR